MYVYTHITHTHNAVRIVCACVCARLIPSTTTQNALPLMKANLLLSTPATAAQS